MTKSKKIISCMLAFATIVSAGSCNGGGRTDTGNSTATTTTAMATSTTVNDDIDNPVDVGDITLDVTDLDTADIAGTTIKYLGVYDPTKAGDVKPAYKYFVENYDATMEIEICPDAEIMENVAKYIAADASPDLVDMRDNTFPYYIAKNSYEPLDQYFDLSAPQWDGVADIIDGYAVGGKHYYYPWCYYVAPCVMIYNRGLFNEYGINDPKELYDAGNWNWDTFYDCMVKFVENTKIEDAIGLYGYMSSSAINSTGKALISYDDGKFVNNLRSPEIDRAETFLEKLKKEGLSSLTYNDYSTVAHEPVIDGAAAFHIVGEWKITDYSKIQAKKGNEDLDIFFVPFPKDPSADKYYYAFKTFGYLVPAGSKNAKASCVFINCVRMSITDEELAATTKESIMKNKKYTDEQYEFWNLFHNATNFESDCLVKEFSSSFDTDTLSTVITPIQEDVPFVDDSEDKVTSWTVLKESNFNMLETKVEEKNTLLGA